MSCYVTDMRFAQSSAPIAYLCAEFGLESCMPLYAGGLGVLAGDMLKAAAETQTKMAGVGLLYTGKNSQQQINASGWQNDVDADFNPTEHGIFPVLINNQQLTVTVPIAHQDVILSVYLKKISPEVNLYLLSSNVESNPLEVRSMTDALYCCSPGDQVRQAILLGCGGYKALKALGIKPSVWHLNEGRPSFLVWEMAIDLAQTHNIPATQALQQAKEKIVYTNHTLLIDSSPSCTPEEITALAQPYATLLNCPTEMLTNQGADPKTNNFSITTLALNSSYKQSGVSRRHTKLSKTNWPEYNWVNITNGVHLKTWQKPDLARTKLSDKDLWRLHTQYKKELAQEAYKRTGFTYDHNQLVVGWARRIAQYKRLDDVFIDVERLVKIVQNTEQPVQLVLAGKTHQGDTKGKENLQRVIQLFQNQLSGHALFIPNYNIELAQHLVSGCDIWLNTPEDGLEACGTSGMKAVSNGVLSCSVEDGWVGEANWRDTGWLLNPTQPGQHFYDLLEREIRPLFYERDTAGLPNNWLQRMKKSIRLAERLSAKRMLREYGERLYSRAAS